MKKICYKFITFAGIFLAACLVPHSLFAQGMGDQVYSLHHVLANLYDEMLPLSGKLIGVARVIAGFAALAYIGTRVWGHIARAEPIDFYPLFRPFGIGLAIMMFPALLQMMNGILKPVETATSAMGRNSQMAIEWYLRQQEANAMATPPPGLGNSTNDQSSTSQYEEGGEPERSSLLGRAASFFSLKHMIQQFISEFFQLLYAAAGLCIDAIRTFYLIILAIIGPLVLGLSVFDGFQQSFVNWLTRYIHVYMWLPVANIFGAISSTILQNMITGDHDVFGSVAYIIFMIISIIGYITVPSVAGYIVMPGGKDTLLHKATKVLTRGLVK